MSDRELLELAAKAFGLKCAEYWRSEPSEPFPIAESIMHYNDGEPCVQHWNPLIDDGDALRLAVKLNLRICIEAESAGVIEIEWDFDDGGFSRHSIEQEAPMDGDDYAATRRAIVRAAAEIGKTMTDAPSAIQPAGDA